jgi:hypothetical protein
MPQLKIENDILSCCSCQRISDSPGCSNLATSVAVHGGGADSVKDQLGDGVNGCGAGCGCDFDGVFVHGVGALFRRMISSHHDF